MIAAKGTIKVATLLTDLAAESAIFVTARVIFGQMGTQIKVPY